MFEHFYGNPVIQKLALERRWTISDKDKVPIDMTDLLMSNGQIIHGALNKKEGHNPYVDLHTLMTHIPNAANNAYWLDAKTDGVIVLDIEPKCPKEIAHELLKLPAYYGEYSMSGNGYHLILPLPNTFPEVYSCMNAVKEEHGYYEFLCNHYVTFTRNVLPAGLVPDMGQASYGDFMKIWNNLAVHVDLDKRNSVQAVLDEEEDTEWTDFIQNILQSDVKAYRKTPDDFCDDMSRYEFGYTCHMYRELIEILKSLKVFYTRSQVVWEVYRAVSATIDYRDKHDTARNGMPWLLYLSAEVAGRNYDEDALHKMTDEYDENAEDEDLADMIESDDENNLQQSINHDTMDNHGNHYFDFEDYEEDSSAYNVNYFGMDD